MIDTQNGHYSQSVVSQIPLFGGFNQTDIALYLATVADDIPPWGTNVRYRDAELRRFYKTESMLSGTVFGTSARYASFQWELEGPDRQIAAVQHMLHNSEHGKGWIHLMIPTIKDYLCLAGPTKVALGGDRLGKYKSIKDIVKDRDEGPVLSTDSSGHFVERKINEWHKTPLGNRQWWHITPFHAKYGGLYLTEDHPMLTDRGWKEAKDITRKMKIATSDPVPSEQQAEVLVGTLLGDASLGLVTKRAMLRFNHSLKQKDWLDYKMSLFKGFQWTGYAIDTRTRGDKEFSQVGVNSRATMGLNSWFAKWYPEGDKHVCKEDVEKYFSPRMLAMWYCDDGSYHRGNIEKNPNFRGTVTLSACGFSMADNDWLAGLLTENGFDCHVNTTATKDHHLAGSLIKGSVYDNLYMDTEAAWKFLNYIAPYIPECMRYKLPPEILGYRPVPAYNESTAEIEPAKIFFDTIIECEPKPFMSGYTEAKTTYHIGVEETRNFIAAEMVSHNTQDNAAFIECIREEDNYKSAVLQLNHLDAARCFRTGNWETPIVYRDLQGSEHLMKWYQVYELVENADPDERMRGYQECAVSRLLTDAQKMRDIAIYEKEKVNGRNPASVHFIGGIQQQRIESILKLSQNRADNQGFSTYQVPPIIAALDQNARVSHEQVDLRSLPDGYDKEAQMRWYTIELALAFGIDPQDIAPLHGNNLGSSSQSSTLQQKARGKGPALFMNSVQHLMNFHGIMPKTVQFSYQEQDIMEDEQLTQLKWRRAQMYSLLAGNGKTAPILPTEVIHQIMRDNGDLDQDYLDQMGEDNMSPNVELDGNDVPDLKSKSLLSKLFSRN